jgi:hypothetical protein
MACGGMLAFDGALALIAIRGTGIAPNEGGGRPTPQWSHA